MVASRGVWISAMVGVLTGAILFGVRLDGRQQRDPQSLPLLGERDLVYAGGFRLPPDESNGDYFAFGGRAMAFNPGRGSLYVSSYRSNVAELSIPTPVNSSDVSALPHASIIQGLADPTEGHLIDISAIDASISGLLVANNRLYGTASIYYDANNTQRFSHFARSVRLDQPSFSGWSQVWDTGKAGYVSGMMATVPAEWQPLLGGAAATGQCCIPIVSRTSVGPAAFAFDPARVGEFAVSASPLLYYTLQHPTLGAWEGSNPTYGAVTGMGGLALIAGTRTALYFGRNGLGTHCYGSGTADRSLDNTRSADGETLCYDPSSSDKGSHAYPYRYQVWAYDLNDFAAVRAGSKQPWDVQPYGVWPLTFPTPEPGVRMGGVAYDSQRQVVYVAQIGADADLYASRPVIHAIRITVPAR